MIDRTKLLPKAGPGERPTVIASLAVSVDGFVATVDGGVDWLAPFMQPGDDYGMGEFMASVGGVLIGSRTYERMLGFEGNPIAAMGQPCWVFSSRNLGPAPSGVTITPESPEVVMTQIADRGISRCWLMGGSRLGRSFRDAGLIAEYALGLIPVVLGSGLPLFESPGPSAKLELIDSKPHPNGVVQLRYRVV